MISRRRRRRHCRYCGCLFLSDRRLKGKQRYCSSEACQRDRRNVNIRDWYKRNPDCLEYQRGLTRQWFKSHPGYSRTRRLKNPTLRKENLLKTRHRMRVLRRRELFDKTNSILTQLNKRQGDKCILTKSRRWLLIGLTKQTRWRSSKVLWENYSPRRIRLPVLRAGYDLSAELFKNGP